MASKRKLLLLSLVAAAIVCIVSLAFFVRRQRAARAARFTGVAEAVITEVGLTDYRMGRVTRERIETVVDESQGKRRRTTRVRYRYSVGNREIEGQIFPRGDRSEDYAVGNRARACYDPRYPEESVLVAPDAECGAP